jgi:hypothetical protein
LAEIGAEWPRSGSWRGSGRIFGPSGTGVSSSDSGAGATSDCCGAVIGARHFGQGPVTPANLAGTFRRTWQSGQ